LLCHWCSCCLLLLAALLGGCASQPLPLAQLPATPAPLLDGDVFGVDAVTRPADPGLLTVTGEMQAFLQQVLDEPLRPEQRINRIVEAVLEQGLELEYDNLLTLSARETFAQRAGNCMSFTNLLVALAREAGLDARYQEVLVPPIWTESEGTWYYNLHVNVLLNLRNQQRVIDFNTSEYIDGYPREAISDEAALARYHNNMGVHWMTAEAPTRAFLHLREALRLEPGSPHFWTNLGTLYRREGFTVRAEASYRHAYSLSAGPVAASQLARLYRSQGDRYRAQWYETRARRMRERNPYYQFHLAQLAYAEARYAQARSHLLAALRKHALDHRFYRLLAQVLWQQGDAEAAEISLRQAHALAGDAHKPAYAQKLAQLEAGHRLH
jgi:Flp pilus assembly protein TadD